ncbi:hypothetical protein [Parvicella tangerina]|uniref:Uncharacterized protein n=1 Tax=Parvicella tangerina TaxID=2829795 RepID=A0A916JLP4_9FLAO|nr:hypothetical protein [Parvicella tangerina]CAG5079712.1 hypothetical protein CRYO30217_01029 [Parvicella tangerina]
MKKYLHLGYPKNFSTSLQRNYFSSHKDIYHLGIGVGSNVGYLDDLTSALFEVYLKSAKDFKYQEVEEKLKRHIDDHVKKAKEQGAKCIGASSEHFSFGFTYESLSFKQKIARAVDLFGKDELHFILVVRNQSDIIKSLFRESVRVGLPNTYEEFIYGLYKFQDRNYVYDLRYDLIYDCLLEFLPAKNIHFAAFESCRDSNKKMITEEGQVKLIKDISSFLEVDYLDVNFQHFNEALTDAEIIAKTELNKNNPHDLGREMLFTAEVHRQFNYFNSELGVEEPEAKVYEDVLMKRKLISEAKEIAKQDPTLKLSYSCSKKIAEWFKEFYEEGNRRFSEKTSIKLTEVYYSLKFD